MISFRIDLVTSVVNLVSNNFRKTAFLKKIWIVTYSFTPNDYTEKHWGRYMQLHALERLFFFVCKNFSSFRLKYPGKNCRQIHRKSNTSVWRKLSTVTAPKILCCSFSLQLIFFSEQPFYANYYSHTNTVISHAVAYSSRWLSKPWQGL